MPMACRHHQRSHVEVRRRSPRAHTLFRFLYRFVHYERLAAIVTSKSVPDLEASSRVQWRATSLIAIRWCMAKPPNDRGTRGQKRLQMPPGQPNFGLQLGHISGFASPNIFVKLYLRAARSINSYVEISNA